MSAAPTWTPRLFTGTEPTAAPEAQNFARLPVAAIADPELSDAAYRVLSGLLLGVYSAAQVVCKTVAQVAADCGKSIPATERGLRELREAGYIARIEHQGRPAWELRFRLKGATVGPLRTEGSAPSEVRARPITGEGAGPSEVMGAHSKRSTRARPERSGETALPDAPAGAGQPQGPARPVAGKTPEATRQAQADDQADAQAQAEGRKLLERWAAGTGPLARFARRALAPEKPDGPGGVTLAERPGPSRSTDPPIVTGPPGRCKRGRLRPPPGPGPDDLRPA